MQAHRLQVDGRVDILQTEYFKLAYLVPFKTEDLPRTGLRNAKVITGQMTVECRAPIANSSITGITAT